jgi:tRNA nucleotidyltransferase (CCA-adding enzyme)
MNHEEEGVAPASAFLDRLNVNSFDGYDVRHQVLGMVANHLKPGAFHKTRDQIGDGAFRRLAAKVDLELLARVAKADCLGRTGNFDCSAMDWFLDRARELGVQHAPPPPLVLGRHLLALGLKPGPRIGEILRAIYEQQLDGKITTTEEGIERAKALAQVRSTKFEG